MKTRHLTWGLLLHAVAGLALADESGSDVYRASVRALASPDFQIREAATRHLVTGGPDALRAVLDFADLTDLEVFTRVVQLIHITAARHDSESMQAALTRLRQMDISPDPLIRSRAGLLLAAIHRRSMESVVGAGGKLQPITWPDGKTGVKVTLYNWRKSTLVALMSLSNLHLVLSGPRFEDGSLTELHKLKNLRVLDVRYTRASDITLQKIAQLTELQKLYLSRTRITDRGVEHLRNLPQLTDLFLTDTGITDRSLQQLKRLPRLRRVSLRGTQITESGVSGFRAQRPECHIQY